MIECRVDPTIAKDRLRERARHASVSDGRLEIFDDFVARWEPIDELPDSEHLVLDTSRSIDDNLAKIRAVLRTWPLGLP